MNRKSEIYNPLNTLFGIRYGMSRPQVRLRTKVQIRERYMYVFLRQEATAVLF